MFSPVHDGKTHERQKVNAVIPAVNLVVSYIEELNG